MYTGSWDSFAAYCRAENPCSVSGHCTTVEGYAGWNDARGTVAASSICMYVSPADTIHELAGYEPPTAHPMLQRPLRCYLRVTAARAGAIPKYVGPLPADIFHKKLLPGSIKPTLEEQRLRLRQAAPCGPKILTRRAPPPP